MSAVKMAGKCGTFRAWLGWLQISLTVPAFLIVVYTAAWAIWHFCDEKWGSRDGVRLQVCLVVADCSSGTLPPDHAGSFEAVPRGPTGKLGTRLSLN